MSKCTKKTAIAVGCHPDDIEFMMAGTLIKLKEAGYEIHYMNVANGSLGTCKHDYETIVKMRREEAMTAAAMIGAIYHESICDDIEVFYNYENVCKVTEVIREVNPDIVLTHGIYDYMEDHINTGRIAVSAAFCRGMTNLKCKQTYPATLKEVAVYHSMPHSFTDQLNRPVVADFYIDVTSTIQTKRDMLACHVSQKVWLDESQGSNAYLDDMQEKCRKMGELSGKFEFAEGWIQHNPLGFGSPEFKPLQELLK